MGICPNCNAKNYVVINIKENIREFVGNGKFDNFIDIVILYCLECKNIYGEIKS